MSETNDQPGSYPPPPLTPQDETLAEMLASGCPTKNAAAAIDVSERTAALIAATFNLSHRPVRVWPLPRLKG
jgi:DNA-binding NarL/FixJ family response regulator